jgi:hypothetical protein
MAVSPWPYRVPSKSLSPDWSNTTFSPVGIGGEGVNVTVGTDVGVMGIVEDVGSRVAAGTGTLLVQPANRKNATNIKMVRQFKASPRLA